MSIVSGTVSLLAANAKRALRRPVFNHALQKDIMQDSSWADVRITTSSPVPWCGLTYLGSSWCCLRLCGSLPPRPLLRAPPRDSVLRGRWEDAVTLPATCLPPRRSRRIMGRRVLHPLRFRQRPQAPQTGPRGAERNGAHEYCSELLPANIQTDVTGGCGNSCELVCVPAWGLRAG